ncbi:MAG: tetratricopeptide repeat protein [Acidimicrobiia bacterium]|nr:tetratricopeptide repeat protein [Acidimicrobiia bacterium]
MNPDLTKEVFLQGLDYLHKSRIPEAANAFRRAFKMDPDNPRHLSYYGLILALAGENLQDAINFCRGAIVRAAYEPEFYVNLSKVYTKAGQRKKALEALVEGMNFDKGNALLRMELKRLGTRRRPTLSFLSRDHILNRSLGMLTYRMKKASPSKKIH